MNTPSYYRARLDAIAALTTIWSEYDKLLGNGHVPDAIKPELNKLIDGFKYNHGDEPLSFTEITRYNTWFDMHPEKVCGTEKVTTSIQFPLTIKGNINDAVAKIREEMKAPVSNKKLLLAKAKAKALKLKLELISQLSGLSLQSRIKSNPYLKISNCTDISDIDSAIDELRRLDAEFGINNKTLIKLWAAFLKKKKTLTNQARGFKNNKTLQIK